MLLWESTDRLLLRGQTHAQRLLVDLMWGSDAPLVKHENQPGVSRCCWPQLLSQEGGQELDAELSRPALKKEAQAGGL